MLFLFRLTRITPATAPNEARSGMKTRIRYIVPATFLIDVASERQRYPLATLKAGLRNTMLETILHTRRHKASAPITELQSRFGLVFIDRRIELLLRPETNLALNAQAHRNDRASVVHLG